MPAPADDPEDADPALARERTMLAWTRTAIAVAALGAVMARANLAAGLPVIAMSAVVWRIGRSSRAKPGAAGPARLAAVTGAIVILSAVALLVALLAPARR